MRKALNVLVFWLFTYPIGMLIWGVFETAWSWQWLEVKGIENFPQQDGKIYLCPNHCSLVEPVLLIGLFGPKFALHPWRYGPWNLAASENYFSLRKWGLFYWPAWPRLIWVSDRKVKKKGAPSSLRVSVKLLNGGANIMGFAETGRTTSVEQGLILTPAEWVKNPSLSPSHLVSQRGRLLRPLNKALFLMARVDGVLTVPAWFEFHGPTNMKLAIGMAREFGNTPPDEIAHEMERALLDLADTV